MKKLIVLFSFLAIILACLNIWTWKKLNIIQDSGTEIKLALDNVVESLDPAKAYSDDSLLVSAQVLEPLYQYHYLKRPFEIQPLIAESLPTVSGDGLTVSIKLKKDIFYHPHPAFKGNRRMLKAEDFVVQFKRLALIELNSPGRGLFNEFIVGFDSYNTLVKGEWKNIPITDLKGVSAIDDHTLVIHLKKTESNLAHYLALNFLSPIPWELVEYQKNNLDEVLLGTGPYIYKGVREGVLSMDRNSVYHPAFYPTSGDRYANIQKLLVSSKEKIPFIDHIEFYVTENEEQRWSKFFNGEIDLLTVPKTLLPKLYDEAGDLDYKFKKENIEIKHFPTLASRWLAFNMRDPLLGKNSNLRRAIAYAIDYKKYIKILSQNTNLRANSLLVPGISGYLPAKDFRFKYDQNLARKYLRLAGFDSQKKPTITYSTRGNQGVSLLEAEFVKEQLEAIGINVNIQVLNFSEFLSKGRSGELMFFTDNWLFDYPDGENILQLLVSTNFPGINKSGYSNLKFDQLYLKLKQTSNLDQKDLIVHQMEDIIFEDLPWIPMMYESSFVLQYSKIKNFRKSSIIRNYIKYLKIEN